MFLNKLLDILTLLPTSDWIYTNLYWKVKSPHFLLGGQASGQAHFLGAVLEWWGHSAGWCWLFNWQKVETLEWEGHLNVFRSTCVWGVSEDVALMLWGVSMEKIRRCESPKPALRSLHSETVMDTRENKFQTTYNDHSYKPERREHTGGGVRVAQEKRRLVGSWRKNPYNWRIRPIHDSACHSEQPILAKATPSLATY